VWAWLMCPLTTSMFMTNMLLWWTLDSAPLRLVIKPKILKKALQWRFERRTQVESYVVTSIKPNKRIEPTIIGGGGRMPPPLFNFEFCLKKFK